jgi:hypothetical protein
VDPFTWDGGHLRFDRYFRQHGETSRIHADWDHADAERVTYGIDGAPHSKGIEIDSTAGLQQPMHLRKTYASNVGKYA